MSLECSNESSSSREPSDGEGVGEKLSHMGAIGTLHHLLGGESSYWLDLTVPLLVDDGDALMGTLTLGERGPGISKCMVSFGAKFLQCDH